MTTRLLWSRLVSCNLLPCQAEDAKSGWAESERELDEALTKGLLASNGLKQCQEQAAAAAVARKTEAAAEKEQKRPRPSKHGGKADGDDVEESLPSVSDSVLEQKLDTLMVKLAVRVLPGLLLYASDGCLDGSVTLCRHRQLRKPFGIELLTACLFACPSVYLPVCLPAWPSFPPSLPLSLLPSLSRSLSL